MQGDPRMVGEFVDRVGSRSRMRTNDKEAKRVESLVNPRLLDTPKQAAFDRITRHCADIFDCSIALISLIDAHRQWFLSSVGVDLKEPPRGISFCSYTIESGCTLLLPNAAEDHRFCNSPLVIDAPAIRSYLGVPLKSPEGELIGTLCVADQREHHFHTGHIARLEALAATVEDLIAAYSKDLRTSYIGASHGARSSRLKLSERIFKQTEKIAKLGSWEYDIETQRLSWSDEAFVIFGSPQNPPTRIEETFPYYTSEDRQRVATTVTQILKDRMPFEFESGLNAADGTIKRLKATGEYFEGDKHSPARLVGVIQDITETYQARLALQRAANRDPLTGLYNRNAFDRFVQNALAEVRQTGSHAFLMMLDLDGFKDINDTFGHLVGDFVLTEISSRIRDALPGGAIVARWGGDEFAVLTNLGLSFEGAEQLGKEILGALNRQFDISGRKMAVSATCGLIEIDTESSAREIVRKADLALYHGKEREPGRVHVYVPSLEKANHFRQVAIATVREALDDDRVYAAYQPIIELTTNRIVGLEALMRLHTITGEQITASEVLPAILDPILSREIGERMLSCVCAELADLEQTHAGIHISINATEADLLTRDFVGHVLSSLNQAGISPAKITLEVTETMLMVNDADTVRDVLSSLSAAGMTIALDDFGTGFSSLSHLRDFPINKVKIDKSFISSFNKDHQSRLIVQALVSMASNLGMEVIAEGVETEAQRNLLIQLGCKFGQGYLYSPAETACRIKEMEFAQNAIRPVRIRTAA